jgi:hypothetical protein
MTPGAPALTIEDYQAAKALLLEHARRRPDIAACWQYGEISQPGVSDLDLIVVVNDDAGEGVSGYLRKESLPDLVREAMAHASVIVVPESAALGVFAWDDIKVTDLGSGRPVVAPPLDEAHLRAAMLVDWAFERSYRVLRLWESGLPNTQLALGMMKSHGYCVENFRVLAPHVDVPSYDALKRDVKALRDGWLSLPADERDRRLHDVFRRYRDFAVAFHAVLFDFAERWSLYPEWRGAGDFDFVFPDGMTLRFVRRRSVELPRRDGKPVIELPHRLLHHFGVYLGPDAALSRKLRGSFRPSPEAVIGPRGDFAGPYAQFLEQRIRFCNQWYDFLKKHGFTFGLFKYGWYLNA